MTKQKILDIMFVAITASLLIHLNWEWTNIKSFLVGGVIGTWITVKCCSNLTK